MLSLSTVPILPQAELRTANVEMFCLQISTQMFSEFKKLCIKTMHTAGFFFSSKYLQ